MLTKQSLASEESRRVIFTQDTIETMAINQHRYCGTTIKIKWKRCYHGYCRQVHKDNLIKGNNNKHIFGGNCKDL